METLEDDTNAEYNLDMNDFPSAKLKVIVELDQNNLRVSCEGPCDVDKWRAAYVRYWRGKTRNKERTMKNRYRFDTLLEV